MQLDDDDLSAICQILNSARRTKPQPTARKRRRWSQCQRNRFLIAGAGGSSVQPTPPITTGNWIFLDSDGFNYLDGNATEFL